MAKKRKKKKTHGKKLNISNYWKNANKTTIRYYLTLVQMAIIEISRNNKCWRGVEKREPSYLVGGNVYWYSYYGELTVEYYSAIKKNEIMPFAVTWMHLDHTK